MALLEAIFDIEDALKALPTVFVKFFLQLIFIIQFYIKNETFKGLSFDI